VNQIKEILSGFQPISLSEMDDVKLMNRVDSKFTFNLGLLPQVLNSLKNNYRILEVANNRISFYKSLYFDSVNHDLYYNHHNKRLNRYKIRHRTYVESNLGFVEIKFKNNKGRTIKNRIKQLDNKLELPATQDFIQGNSTLLASLQLQEVLWVNYHRITLVNIDLTERLTLDINMEFEGNTQTILQQNLVIAELKQGAKKASFFTEIAKQLKLAPGSISKYCLGMALTHTHLKSNNFKPAIARINKINYQYVSTNY